MCLLRGTDWFYILWRRIEDLNCLNRSVDGLSPLRPVFHPRPIHVDLWWTKYHYNRFSFPVLQFSPVSIIPPMLHTHSFTYHPHYMFLSQYFSFPCQYHSTNAPYPFIHLPPTLYVSLPVLQFSPVTTIPPMLHTHLHFNTTLIRRTSGRNVGTFKLNNAISKIEK